jgi:hypothetical protein
VQLRLPKQPSAISKQPIIKAKTSSNLNGQGLCSVSTASLLKPFCSNKIPLKIGSAQQQPKVKSSQKKQSKTAPTTVKMSKQPKEQK